MPSAAGKPTAAASKAIDRAVPTSELSSARAQHRTQRWLSGARRLLLSEHYVYNVLVILTYGLLRWRYSGVPLRELELLQIAIRGSSRAADWASWERLALAGCFTGALRAIVKARSMDGGAAATLRYGQVRLPGAAVSLGPASQKSFVLLQ